MKWRAYGQARHACMNANSRLILNEVTASTSRSIQAAASAWPTCGISLARPMLALACAIRPARLPVVATDPSSAGACRPRMPQRGLEVSGCLWLSTGYHRPRIHAIRREFLSCLVERSQHSDRGLLVEGAGKVVRVIHHGGQNFETFFDNRDQPRCRLSAAAVVLSAFDIGTRPPHTDERSLA